MNYFESNRRNCWTHVPASAENIRLDVPIDSQHSTAKNEMSYRTLIYEYSNGNVSSIPFEEETSCFERYRYYYEEDSIIDNSEARLDSLPYGKQPVGGGFYINYGPLQLEPKPISTVEKAKANSVMQYPLSNSLVQKLEKKFPEQKRTPNYVSNILQALLTEKPMQVSKLVKPECFSISEVKAGTSTAKEKQKCVNTKPIPNSVTVIEPAVYSTTIEPMTNSSLKGIRLSCVEGKSPSYNKVDEQTKNNLGLKLKSKSILANRKLKDADSLVKKSLQLESRMHSGLLEPKQNSQVNNEMPKVIRKKRIINTSQNKPRVNILPKKSITDFLPTKSETHCLPTKPIADFLSIIPESFLITQSVTDLHPTKAKTSCLQTTPMNDFLPTNAETNCLLTNPMTDFLPAKARTNCSQTEPMTDFLSAKTEKTSLPKTPATDFLPTKPKANCLPHTKKSIKDLQSKPMTHLNKFQSATKYIEKMSETNLFVSNSTKVHPSSKSMSMHSTKVPRKSHAEQNKILKTSNFSKVHRDSELKKKFSVFDARSSQKIEKCKAPCKTSLLSPREIQREIEALKCFTGKFVWKSGKTESD